MAKTTKQSADKLNEQAALITSEISGLINQYTNDSSLSKFFLPEEISASFYIIAGGFAAVVYKPKLDIEVINNTHALTFFLIMITFGFQIFLKERSLRTGASPYRHITDSGLIDKASMAILEKAESGMLISSPLSEKTINLIYNHMVDSVNFDDFLLTGYSLEKVRFYAYIKISLYFGYNIASYLIDDNI